MQDFQTLFPEMAKFWQFTEFERESVVREGGKPENIVGVVNGWMTDVVMYDIPVDAAMRQKCTRQFSLSVRAMRQAENGALTPDVKETVAVAGEVISIQDPVTDPIVKATAPEDVSEASEAVFLAEPVSAGAAVNPLATPGLLERLRSLSKKAA